MVFRRSGVAMLDQMMGRSAFSSREDVHDWLTGMLKTNFEPPLPSPIGAGLGIAGVTLPEGISGEAFMPKKSGFREYNRPDNVWERITRNLAPSVADFWSQYNSAYHSAPDVFTGISGGAKAVGYRAAQRTSLVRDIIGVKPQVAGTTRLTEEVYSRKKTIDDLHTFISNEVKNRGMVNTKGRSRAGAKAVQQNIDPSLIIGKQDQTPAPGLPQPEPTNPIFALTMKAIQETYIKDSPAKGGKGFLSMWSLYGQHTKFINSLRNVTDGNAGIWKEKMEKQEPAYFEAARKEGIDTDNWRMMRDYYTDRRNKVMKELFYYIRAGKQQIDKIPQIRQTLGPDKHFTLDMADPYKPGLKPPKED
jgi:hypothetical protein